MVRNIFAIVVVLSVLLASASYAHAWEFSFDNYAAGVIYEESDEFNGVSISSDWRSFYYKGMFSFSKYDNKNFQGELFYGIGVSTKATESWDLNDIEVQTNDMSFWNIDTGALAGWAFAVKPMDKCDLTLTPLIGYRWKFDRFTRTNFVILRTVTVTDIVDEDFNIHSLDLGGRISVDYDNFSLYAKPIFGIVLYSDVRNSMATGNIKGDGGFLFNLDTGIDYSLTKNLILGAAFRMELQNLTGNSKGNILWPDNTLQSYGGTVSVRYKF